MRIAAMVVAAACAGGTAYSAEAPLARSCGDTGDAVYGERADGRAAKPGDRGRILRCAPAESATAGEVTQRLAGVGGVSVQHGYRAVRIAYQTERQPGQAGAGTARVYLPAGSAPPAPLVLIDHPTVGLADRCAPSRDPRDERFANLDALVLPWVGAGYVVVAPDYAGLGNPDVQGYANSLDSGHSAVDAVRAARKLLARHATDGRLIVAGHSQGGGVSIVVQGIESSYGAPDVRPIAVVGFAPGYSHLDVAKVFATPSYRIDTRNGLDRAIWTLMLYADFANLFGEDHAVRAFTPRLRPRIQAAVDRQCVSAFTTDLALPGPLYRPPQTLGDLVDPGVLGEVSICESGGNCSELARAYTQRTRTVVAPDPKGGPLLIVIGDQDDLAGQACLVAFLAEHGVHPQVCVEPGIDHASIVAHSAGFAATWARAVAAGKPRPACPHDGKLPACPR